MIRIKSVTLLFLIVFSWSTSLGATPRTDSLVSTRSIKIHPGRLAGVLTVQSALYLGSLSSLYFAWYSGYPQSSFHFFNDNNEWLQMDKAGHATTAYYIAMIGYHSYRWAGIPENKAALFGSLLSIAYMLNIEVLDGFSSEWGFSAGDFAANTAGSLLFAGQQLAWKEQRFQLKYSFHQTNYSKYRPNLLGSNLIQNMIKDYNGHTYWVSGNISSLLRLSSGFPKWINFAIGYGAEGMTGAVVNSDSLNSEVIPHSARYRQFYLSMDIDLTRIPTHSRPLKAIFALLSFIKIPFPTLEYNTLGQFRFHPLYF